MIYIITLLFITLLFYKGLRRKIIFFDAMIISAILLILILINLMCRCLVYGFDSRTIVVVFGLICWTFICSLFMYTTNKHAKDRDYLSYGLIYFMSIIQIINLYV